MTILKPILIALALLFLQFSLKAQETSLKLAAFDKLEANGKLEILLFQGDREALEMEASIDDIDYTIVDGTLKLSPSKEAEGRTVQVKIFFKKLYDIEIAYGTSIRSVGTIKSVGASPFPGEEASVKPLAYFP